MREEIGASLTLSKRRGGVNVYLFLHGNGPRSSGVNMIMVDMNALI